MNPELRVSDKPKPGLRDNFIGFGEQLELQSGTSILLLKDAIQNNKLVVVSVGFRSPIVLQDLKASTPDLVTAISQSVSEEALNHHPIDLSRSIFELSFYFNPQESEAREGMTLSFFFTDTGDRTNEMMTLQLAPHVFRIHRVTRYGSTIETTYGESPRKSAVVFTSEANLITKAFEELDSFSQFIAAAEPKINIVYS